MQNEMISAKVAQLRALEEQSKLINAQMEVLKNELKAELDARQVDSITVGPDRIWYIIFERKQADTDKLKKAGLFEQYSKKSVVTQFKFTTSLT